MRRTFQWLVGLAALLAISLAAPDPSSALRSPPCGIHLHVDTLLGCGPGPPSSVDPAGPDAAATPAPASRPEARPAFRTFSEPRYDPRRIVVRFRRGTAPTAVATIAARVHAVVERRIPELGLYALRTSPERRDEVVRQLAGERLVAAAEREILVGAAEVTPNDAGWPAQSGLRTVGLPAAWELSRGSADVLVAVVDTGVNASHPDLAGAVEPGWDFVNGDSRADDDHGHGTAAAGVIAARADNREGIAGVCWLCRILPVKVLDARGVGTSAAVAEGIVWSANRGARVINLSLGAPENAGALDDAVAYARSRGAIVVAAAGNAGTSTQFYPAAAAGVISVAATNLLDELYSWSNRGAWVVVAAPGCNVAPHTQGYVEFCGTSSAAPLVSGLAALAVARQPAIDPERVREVIVRTASPIGDGVPAGRVNAATALALVPDESVAPRATVRYRAKLQAGARAYGVDVSPGVVVATLRASRTLSLTLSDARGARLAAATGRRSVRLERWVPEGRIVVQVRGPRHAPFSLDISYARPDDGERVLLSAIPDLPPLAQLAPAGPRLGRPELGEQPVLALSVRLTGADAESRAIAAAINELRRRHGLVQLKRSAPLARAGSEHARMLAIAGAFTHDWPGGVDFARWIPRYYRTAGFGTWRAGENLLWTEPDLTASQAIEAWLASPAHRRILLAASWRELGIGAVRAEGAGGVFGGRTVYLVAAEFGVRR